MEIWIDSANKNFINSVKDSINAIGVHTNPAILAKDIITEFSTPQEFISSFIKNYPNMLLAIQVTAESAEDMIKQAIKISEISKQIIIKIPATDIGYQVIKELATTKIKIMATSIYNLTQLIMALNLEVDYAAIYIGGILQNFSIGKKQLEQMQNITQQANSKTKIIGGGIEHISQLIECYEVGIDAIAVPPSLLQQLIKPDIHTTLWIQKMNEEWEKAGFNKDILFYNN